MGPQRSSEALADNRHSSDTTTSALSEIEICQSHEREGLDNRHQLGKVGFQMVDLLGSLLHSKFLKANCCQTSGESRIAGLHT